MSAPLPTQRLGPYELIACIGKGGMGEVWRARDTRLDRDVAIKFARAEFIDRFQREANAIASLNHFNVCTLFDVGPDYLVMELIEGPTLADRIQEGPIPLDEALAIARQTAAALEAAHERGIVHRDLKPGNIKIRTDGSVKVLDFGLAKSAATETIVTHDSPTLMQSPTQFGVILGTAAYMAPEQARGKSVDKRADIWAFGVVLYEMLTARRPFEGEDLTETLASVVKSEPNLMPVPHKIRRLLAKCLEKDPKDRLRDIGDWPELLREDAPPAHAQQQSGTRLWLGVAMGLAFVAAAAVIVFFQFRGSGAIIPPTHLALSLPPNVTSVNFLALSHDARNLVLSVDYKDGPTLSGVVVRPLDSDELRAIPNTPTARELLWSPDTRSIVFWDDARLKLVSASGGPPQQLCDKPVAFGGSWNQHGIILSGTGPGGTHLVRINASTGACELLPGNPAIAPLQPYFLPDGEHFLFNGKRLETDTHTGDSTGIYSGSLKDPSGKRLLRDDSSVIYAPGGDGRGFLIFVRDGALAGQAFDTGSLSLRGDVFKIADDVSFDDDQQMMAAAAPGVLVYGTGKNSNTELTWLDRTGKALSTSGSAQAQAGVAVSPDGELVALSRNVGVGETNIWVRDLLRGSETRATASALGGASAVWSPDGKKIVFSGLDGNLYRRDIASGGREELILKNGNSNFPSDWSHDGRYLLFTQFARGKKSDIRVLPDPGGNPGKPWIFQENGDADLSQAQISRDGRWVAYVSTESGDPEVFVRPFASGAERRKVSYGVGSEPRWRSDGKEIYYITAGKPPLDRFMSVSVSVGPNGSFSAGEPRSLFETKRYGWLPALNLWSYAPSPDGQRFLVLVKPDVPETIHVLSNWTQILKK